MLLYCKIMICLRDKTISETDKKINKCIHEVL